MGIYDRDYYRDDEVGYWDHWSDRKATIILMIVVGFGFIMQVLSAAQVRSELGSFGMSTAFWPRGIVAGEAWRLFTCYLIHGRSELFSVIIALFGLYFFLGKLESRLKTFEVTLFIIITATLVSCARLAWALTQPDQLDERSYGMTPVLCAIIVQFALYFRHESYMFITLVPSWLISLIVLLVTSMRELRNLGDIHSVGVVVAVVLSLGYFYQPYRLSQLFQGRKQTTRLKLSNAKNSADLTDQDLQEAVRSEAAPSRSTATHLETKETYKPVLDEHLEAKLDQILEKIGKLGRASLNAQEEDVLKQAGELIKKRKAGQ